MSVSVPVTSHRGGRAGRRLRRALPLLGGAAAVTALVATGCASASTGRDAATRAVTSHLSYDRVWEVHTAYPVVLSSPIPATLQRIPSVVVGTYDPATGRGGQVVALGLAHGGAIRGWPVTTPSGIGVNSAPSVNGTAVYVSVGNPSAGAAGNGGYLGLTDTGRRSWFTQVPVVPGGSTKAGVQASMAFGVLDGAKSVVAGSLGQWVDELRSSTGATRPGWPWLATDSSFDTPAIANLYGNGKNWIVLGNDQTGNSATHEKQGGHLWVLSGAGHSGSSNREAGVNCQFTPDQGVESSPAVGRFLGGDDIGIAFGTSDSFKGAGDTDKVFALDTHCRMMWKAGLDGLTTDSPALVDALGNGHLQVAEGTNVNGSKGTVYLLDGTNGRPDWSHTLPAPVVGGITSANLGGGHQDLLVPTPRGLYVLDGRTGAQVGELAAGMSLQSSALVTDDGGHIGITVAGMQVVDGRQRGVVATYRIGGTNGRLADEAGAWPMFHHDPQLTGTTLPRLR